MKIERLTENKIRIIIKPEDLADSNLDLHTLMTKELEQQNLLKSMLSKAEKELNFNTDGCKLLIEAFSSPDNIIVFTITRYKKEENTNKNISEESFPTTKKLSVRRKTFNLKNSDAIYSFKNFDEFCNFCISINNMRNFEIKKMCKNISLYLYNDVYYLVLNNINLKYENLKHFYFTISEFAHLVNFSKNFEYKLIERGKVIIKKNAISTGIKYFAT